MELLSAGDFEAASAIYDSPWPLREMYQPWPAGLTTQYRPQFKSPSWSEFSKAERTFVASAISKENTGGHQFVAVRGRIKLANKLAGYAMKFLTAQNMVTILNQIYAGRTDFNFVADVNTNSVLVNAPPEFHAKLGNMIAQLDATSTSAQVVTGPTLFPRFTPENLQKLRSLLEKIEPTDTKYESPSD